MKNLRTVGAACVLALTMAAPAFAGHIETDIAPPQPPPSAAGHIETGVTPADAVTEAALSLLQSVLTLF